MKFIYWTLILQPYLQPVSGPFFGPSRVIGQQRYRQPRKREIVTRETTRETSVSQVWANIWQKNYTHLPVISNSF